jgi:hypothetical protein
VATAWQPVVSDDLDKPPVPNPDDPFEPVVISLLRYPLDSPEFADAASVAGPAEIAANAYAQIGAPNEYMDSAAAPPVESSDGLGIVGCARLGAFLRT